MRFLIFVALITGCFGSGNSSSGRIHNRNDGFCGAKPNGHYPTGASCSSEMIVCVAGELVNRIQCPFNLIFDEKYQRCDNAVNVESCGMRAAGVDENYDYPNAYGSCLFDGYSSISMCSASFVKCENGIPELFECTSDKVYDRNSGQCIESSESDECSALRNEKEEEVAAQEATVERKKSLDEIGNIYSCVDREDGIYSLGCESQFLTCSGGVSRVMRCPVNLIYDNITEACEHPVNVLACADNLTINGGGAAGNVSRDANADVCAGASSADWFEVDKCSSLFFTCRQGEKVQLACPSSLIFCPETLRCKYRHNVTGCQESPEKSLETGKMPDEVEKSSSKIEKSPETGKLPDEVEKSHSGSQGPAKKIPGGINYSSKSSFDNFGKKSTPRFIETTTLAGELASGVKQSSGNLFDDYGRSFEEPSEIQKYSPASFSGFEDFSGTSSGEISDESSKGLFFDSKSFDEFEESSGRHGSGAFSGEGSGFGTETSEMIVQSSGLEFIEASGDGLLEFSGSEESISIESSGSEFSGDSFPGGDQSVEVSELIATGATFCINQLDGFYGQGCSSLMIACANGIPTLMVCPTELKYEAEKQICDLPSNVAACSKKVSNETADELVDVVTVIDNGTNVENVQRLKRSSHKAIDLSSLPCHNRTDGRFSFGCEESFLSCHQGRGRVMQCGTGKTLDENLQRCVSLELHSRCFQQVQSFAKRGRGKVALLNVNSGQAVESGVDGSGENSGQDYDGNEQASQFSCSKDGYFAKTICSSSYVHCYHGKPCEMKCDHGYVYSASVQMCLRITEMPECIQYLALPDSYRL